MVATKIKMKTMRVTPRKAQEWLADNQANRKVSDVLVERYANDMRDGRWQLNGEPVIFNGSSLLDGQHRLHAIVRANVPVDMHVVTGVPTSAFRTIDSGKARTLANVLQASGHKNANNLAGALSLLNAFGRPGPFRPGVNMGTKQHLEALLAGNPDIEDYVTEAVGSRTPVVTVATVAFCHYVFAQKSADEAHKFIRDLVTGDGVKASSPVGLLRERLITESAGGRRLDRRLVIYLIFRAWNATRTKENLRSLQVPRSALQDATLSVELPPLV